MADMTSTLTFSGVINGKTVTYTNTYTVTDVEDAADNIMASAPDPILSGGASFPLTNPTMDYSSPQFMIFQNTSDCDRLQLTMTNNTGPVNASVTLNPGEMFIMNKANDGGCFNDSGTATTSTFLDLEQASVSNLETNGPQGPFRLFAAYKNPSS